MARLAETIEAKIAFIGKEKEGDRGPYKSVLFTHPDAPDPAPDHQKYWISFNPDQYALVASFRKGQLHSLIQNPGGKGYSLLSNPSIISDGNSEKTNYVKPVNPLDLWTDEERDRLKRLIVQHSKMMGFCLEQVQTNCGGVITEQESLKAIANTIYIRMFG